MSYDNYKNMKQQQILYTRGNPNTLFKYIKFLQILKNLISFVMFIGSIFLVYLYWGQSLEDIADTSIWNKIGFYISKMIYYFSLSILILICFILAIFVLMGLF